MSQREKVVLVTGVTGGIGSRVAAALKDDYCVLGMDLDCEEDEKNFSVDLRSSESVTKALNVIRERFGSRLASVVHLAAYFDFSGEDNPLYEEVNVDGTRRLLEGLQNFEVEQFLYSSTMLVHEPTSPGVPITEDSPLDPAWQYPQSKLETEDTIERHHGAIPYTVLRIAGVYDDNCNVPTLAHQMQRIYERHIKGHLFAGKLEAGQSFVHRDDVVDAICRAVRCRAELKGTPALLIGEPEVLSYQELQQELARLIHGENWLTRSIPKPLAKFGAWLQVLGEKIVPDAIDQGREPFIKPFMISLSDDHYEIDIARAREKLKWSPRHALRDGLPTMVERLKGEPEEWYRRNKLTLPMWLMGDEVDDSEIEELRKRHTELVRREHRQNLWAHFLTIALGAWLLTSPPTLGYQSAALALSDMVCGILVMAFAALSLSWRMPWARMANGAIGVYLLFAPLLFWAPTAAEYLNDTLVGALVIGFATVVRPPVGVSVIARMTGPDVPPGWEYSPSSWTQRLPVIALAFVGLYISRYLAAYQLGHIEQVWDPFFGDGTARIIASDVSRAWPVPDAGVGAVTYTLEILTGLVGSRRRWRTMPWMVLLFGIMIVPLGAVSIFFIIIQPIVIGTWCTLCLIAAAAMVIQIPYSLDELVATCQFLAERRRKGRPLWKVLLHGDTAAGGRAEPPSDFEQPVKSISREMWGGGLNLPWTLIASIAIGISLMCTRLIFGTDGAMANSDHVIGALVVTVSVTSLAEQARSLRYLNVIFGVALITVPWVLDGGSLPADLASAATGVVLILLSIPRGQIRHSYGSWDRFIF